VFFISERWTPSLAPITPPGISITTPIPLRSGHSAEDQDFLHHVTESIADAGAILITGPANAKTELVKHIHHHDPRLIDIIAGVETVYHPSDGTLVAYARKYFEAADLMQTASRV
jgi:hypothetical protein